jgi:hypothetical protein
VETLQRPELGEPVNVQIIVAPQLSSLDETGKNQYGQQQTSQDSSSGSGTNGERRRGIFNIPIPSLELPRLSPATINIQIPGKLYFILPD